MIYSEAITTREKLTALSRLKNEAELRDVLLDLLRRMGFGSVQLTHQHGRPEFGKDIIATYSHKLEGEEWYSFVVKHGRILGGATQVEEIVAQIAQSFEYPYMRAEGNELRVNKVRVVTNENISKGAIETISGSVRLKTYSNFEFWPAEKLADYIDEFYPEFWKPGSLASKEYSRAIQGLLQTDIEVRELSIGKLSVERLSRLLRLYVNPRLTELHQEKHRKLNSAVARRRVNLDVLIESDDNFIIQGDPGSGKSRLLGHILRQMVQSERIEKKRDYPIRIALKTLRANGFSVMTAIEEELRSLVPFHEAQIRAEKLKFTVLIDCADDLYAGEIEKLTEAVGHEVECNSCRFILTTRSMDRAHSFGKNGFRQLHLHQFNEQQVERFVTEYFGGSERGNRLLSVLRNSNILSKLPTTPLTLTLISLLYEDTDYEIPATITDIYVDFTNVLLGRLQVRSRTQLMELEIKKRIYSHFAYRLLSSGSTSLSFDEFSKEMSEFLTSRGMVLDSVEDLRRLVENSGVLYIDETQNVGFKHLSFAEFFTAYEIFYVQIDRRDLLIRGFSNMSWQNAAVFYAGFSKDMPWLVTEILEHSPSSELRDWVMAVGGLGYLCQALYLTDRKLRTKLVERALEDSCKAFSELKAETAKPGSYQNLPLHVIAGFLAFWFTVNFQSVTLVDSMEEAFSSLISMPSPESAKEGFERGFKLLLLATTLSRDYLGKTASLEQLLEQDWFMKDPLLIAVTELFLDMDDDMRQQVPDGSRRRLEKRIVSYRKLLGRMTKDPAYRFSDDYRKLPKPEQPK